MEENGKFYLGRTVDIETNNITERPLHYTADDLTTHALVVGMTGSGKTGLCLDLLEEAALNQIPSLMIDPKGDITNALLHFPQLRPSDFEPWINPSEARQADQTTTELAEETAVRWREGLAEWDIHPERIQKLSDSVEFSIYTPGSDAGLPLSILASLQAPTIPWDENREILREKISSTVTGLLGLVGLKDIDPVRSRDHILLANIFEQAWQNGQDLDLAQLILQTQNPPFEKLGVFDINTFFPEKDRFELAMMLNNILAAPTFQSWIEGEPLDVAKLLWDENGRPRHTIFYIAHLSDSERMFFVTLLYAAVETWMRSQQGSTTLRALIYFDEIFGYLPPVANPPSKKIMLRLLKQARAFGVGLVLATQNPADVDYKALSNAGSWFIGKLATEQDKNRLLDGLLSAGSVFDRAAYDDLISQLDKRVFLLRNVHEEQPLLFHTRWAMNYLAGPVTRTQIGALNALVRGEESDAVPMAQTAVPKEIVPPIPSPSPPQSKGSSLPVVARGIESFTLPVNQAETGESDILYYPVLLAQADVLFANRKYGIDASKSYTAVVAEVADSGRINWADHESEGIDLNVLENEGVANGRYAPLSDNLNNSQRLRSLKTDFIDWLYRHSELMIKANEKLKVYAASDMSDEEFRQQCVEAVRPKVEVEIQKVEAQFDKKEAAIHQKISREERELEQDKGELRLRKQEESLTHAETLLGLFSRRRRSLSTSLSKRRQTQRAKADVQESEDSLREMEEEITRLEAEEETALLELRQKWIAIVDEVTEMPIKPYKKDVNTAVFGIAWFPYYVYENGNEHPAFEP